MMVRLFRFLLGMSEALSLLVDLGLDSKEQG